MPDDIQIKQFDLTETEALLSFMGKAYVGEPRKSEPAYWRWHYLESPYTSPDDLPLWVARSGERIVGHVAALPVDLKIGEESTRAIWMLDLVVDADYRGRGLGKGLMATARASCPTQLTIGFNDLSAPVLRSLKWFPLGGIHRYHRLLYPGDALGGVSRLSPVRQLLNLAYAPFRPQPAALSDGLELREIKSFDASFDDLWQRARSQWPCAVRRSARYLEWQFMRQPGKKFDVLGLYLKEKLAGYAVLFFRKPERVGSDARSPKAAITDLFYDEKSFPGIVDELLHVSLRLALERRAGSLVTDVLDVRVEERLRRLGFRHIKRSPQFMANASEYQDLLYDARNWFLTRADSDISIFEEANL
jgi:GNAT superfamily N-acetyltransferase